jgi:hypothetical protein
MIRDLTALAAMALFLTFVISAAIAAAPMPTAL